jgi:hypothetical protein
VNEARARLNLPPIEGGDAIFIPLNSMRAGGPQASPQNPVDTPSNGLNPVGTTPTPTPSTASLLPSEYVKAALDPSATSIEEILAHHDGKRASMKAMTDHVIFLKETRLRYEERHARMFEKFFTRQRASLTGSKSPTTRRWDKELADDLFGVTLQTVETFGSDAAKRVAGKWSTANTVNFLKTRAEATAKSINEATQERIAAEDDGVFDESRSKMLARSSTTFAMAWAISEAVHQNEASAMKTWVVTSDKPRAAHAAMDGETISMDELFSNGLSYPGDSSNGSADEVANCACVMALTKG